MHSRIKAGIAIAAVVLASAVTASPANASASSGYLDGSGAVTNDWGDEGLLSTTSYNHSNLAGWWQQILYSDGYLEAGSQDCWFGPKTEAATKAWQRDHGLVADGIVGPNTWGKADDKLYWNSSRGYIQYRGDKYTRGPIHRDSQGRYYAYHEGTAYYVSYTVANLPTCS